MKILVSLPEKINKSDYAVFLEGIEALKNIGHTVKFTFSKDLSADSLTKTHKSIKDCDIYIAEVTNADSKLGFEIATALNEKKFVLALYTGKEEPSITKSNKARNIISKSYDKSNAGKLLLELVDEAKSKLDTKFILIISPEIDRFLEWASQAKRMHKAQIVRDAIETVIKKDKDYKDYLSK